MCPEETYHVALTPTPIKSNRTLLLNKLLHSLSFRLINFDQNAPASPCAKVNSQLLTFTFSQIENGY